MLHAKNIEYIYIYTQRVHMYIYIYGETIFGSFICIYPGVGDGQGGLACCNSCGRKESDRTERLN